MKINIAWDQALNHGKEIIRNHNRRRGLLRKEQLEMINQCDDEIISCSRKLS